MSNLMQSNDNNNNKARISYLENQLCLARREINNLRQQLKTLSYVHKKEIDEIERKLEDWRCLECQQRQDTTSEVDAHGNNDLSLKPIGVINTNFPEKRGTPRQPGICAELTAKLTLNNNVFTNPNHAIEGLEGFSHMWILFHFHKNDSHSKAKVTPPRLNGTRTGVFATRSPHRPNPIGLSLVKIIGIEGNCIYFNGVDMVDGSPVIDLKPYIPQYDNPDSLIGSLYQRNSDITTTTTPIPSTSSSQIDNIRIMDGEENSRDSDPPIGAASNQTIQTTVEEYTRSSSRIGEREAPDGEEEETPIPITSSNSITIPTTPEGHITIPSWIDQPAVSTLTVLFKERALTQLLQLGVEGEQKKTIITNVLREDPRSIYLRERWGSHCYVFRIAELCVSCKFNDDTHTVTVYQVFQNNASECDE